MSLRDFLLDYAEKAPKAERVGDEQCIRFGEDCLCPLELAADMYAHHHVRAIDHYGLDDELADFIVDAADGNTVGGPWKAWRAILEKLAEPEVGA